MRCLYCGKELAFLKRLTGGGEFCSEGHRERYQEEYNQLALSRLLQGKNPPPEPSAAADGPGAAAPGAMHPPEPAVWTSGPLRIATEPAGEPAPVPLLALATSVASEEPAPAQPSEPPLAPNVHWEPHVESRSMAAAPHKPPFELREPALRTPACPVELLEARPTPPPPLCMEALRVSAEARLPEPAAWWTAPAPAFEAPPIRFGELARLAFPPASFREAPAAPSQPPLAPPVPAGVPRWANVRPVTLQPMRVEPMTVASRTIAPQPASHRTIHPAPAGIAAAPASRQPEARPAPPDRVTNQLPLTLHGMAGPAPRPAVVFNSVALPAAEPQLPPSISLPLRPVMLVGPAPETTTAPPREPAQAAAPQPQPPAAPPPAQSIDLGLPALRLEVTESRWSRLPVAARLGLAAAIVAAVGGLGYFAFFGSQAPAGTPTAAAQSTGYQVGLPIADNGWIEDWAGTGRGVPKITLLRGSTALSDYRMEFQAQIERRAIGWAYRALNPRNYYVAKIEALEAGLEPRVALVRYAVIDGQREPRVERPLEMKARVDTVYKIRFEAVGGRFSVWVQDQKIDEWNDRRIGSGGIGLYSETGEIAALHSAVNVVPLVPRN
jgi:hypothetical protein